MAGSRECGKHRTEATEVTEGIGSGGESSSVNTYSRGCSYLFLLEVPDPLVDIRINRMIRLGQVTRSEKGTPNVLHVVVTDGARKNRQQIADSQLRWLHQDGIVELRMHPSRMDIPPAVAESVRIITADLESFGVACTAGLRRNCCDPRAGVRPPSPRVARRKNDRRRSVFRLVECVRPSL